MTTNSLVVFVLIYTKKVFIMVFRRSKNTPVYYQRKKLEGYGDESERDYFS